VRRPIPAYMYHFAPIHLFVPLDSGLVMTVCSRRRLEELDEGDFVLIAMLRGLLASGRALRHTLAAGSSSTARAACRAPVRRNLATVASEASADTSQSLLVQGQESSRLA
jgi:hypothetical protein